MNVPSVDKPLLALRKISCERADRMLFSDVSLDVFPQDIVQIEGPNGAGKTSLLRIVCGLLRPVAGSVFFRDVEFRDDPEAFYRDCVYIGHQSGIKKELTVSENLHFYASASLAELTMSVDEAIEAVGLRGYNNVSCAELSAGQHRRVALARLLIASQKLWILDEPFVALDKRAVAWLEGVLVKHAKNGGAVIFTSHQDFGSDYPLKTLSL